MGERLGGKGGGRADSAQGGSKETAQLAATLAAVPEVIASLLASQSNNTSTIPNADVGPQATASAFARFPALVLFASKRKHLARHSV